MLKIKEAGTWKEVDSTSVKSAGNWKIANDTFMKIAGHWVNVNDFGSTHIDYDMVYDTDTDGTRYLVDKNDPTKFKAPIYSGRGVALGGHYNKSSVDLTADATAKSMVYYDKSTNTFMLRKLGDDKAMKMVVEVADGFEFVLPLDDAQRQNLIVDWGDGTAPVAITTGDVANTKKHTYVTAGSYQIKITGDECESWNSYFRGTPDKIISIDNLGDIGVENFGSGFRKTINMTQFNGNGGVGDKCADIGSIFNGVNSNIDFNGLSLGSNVTTVNQMFSGRDTKIDFTGIDTTGLTTMYGMFLLFTGSDIIGLDVFNIATITNADMQIPNDKLSTVEYDKLLISWNNQSHQSNVTMTVGNAKYTAGGAAETARNGLVTDGWTITDGGGV